MSVTAAFSARSLGYDTEGVAALMRTVTRTMFYKSMTSFHDHRQWQDVYYVPSEDGSTIYLKFTNDTSSEFIVLSFKEK